MTEKQLWRCWSLTPCFLPAVRDLAPSHECTQIKHQYLQNTTFEFGLTENEVSFAESPTDKFLIHIAVLMSKTCSGVQVQQGSKSLGTAVWSPTVSDYTSAPFPTSHWKWPVHGRTSSSSEGKSKQSISYFSVSSPLLLVALSGNSLLVVFILKSDNISQIPSHQRVAIYVLWNVFPGIAEILPPSKNAQHFSVTDSNTPEFLQCPWMCFGCLKFKGTAVKWDDNCAVRVLKEN